LGLSTSFDARFVLTELIGEGSFARCYRCTDRKTRETYAVKVLPKRRDKVDDDVVATKIQREVDILRAVQDGPTIVDMYGAFEDGEQAYVVMEELSGGSLGKLVFGGAPLTERELAFLCHDILTALAHVHQRGVVFGDVKPSNFLFTNNARLDDPPGSSELPTMAGMRPRGMHLKAVDFGCSQWYHKGHWLRSRTGTPVYIAPEVLLREYGPPADVWSAGMMIYHLVARRLPYWESLQGLTPATVMRAILHDDISYDLPAWEQVHPSCRDLVSQMLDHSPDCRITACRALRHPWFREMGVETLEGSAKPADGCAGGTCEVDEDERPGHCCNK